MTGGLDNHGATGGQGRAHLAGNHGGREIPRGNGRAHADGLLEHDDALIACVCGNGVAIHALGFFAKPFDKTGGIGNFAAGLGQRLALLGGHDLRQVFLVGHNQLEPAAQNNGPFFAGAGAPLRQCALCSLDGPARFCRACFGHSAHKRTGGRVGDCQSGAVVGIDPGSIDGALRTQQAGIGEFHKPNTALKIRSKEGRDRVCGKLQAL